MHTIKKKGFCSNAFKQSAHVIQVIGKWLDGYDYVVDVKKNI